MIWNWANLKNQRSLDLFFAHLWGIRFDITALVLLFLPTFVMAFLLFHQKVQKIYTQFVWANFLILVLPMTILNMVDVEFVNFVGRRFTADTLFVWGEAQGKLGAFFDTYKALFVINFVITCLSLFLVYRMNHKNKSSPFLDRIKFLSPAHLNSSFKKTAVLVLFIFIYLLASRGGLQKKPLSFAHAQMYPAPQLNQMVLNTPFTVIKSLEKKSVSKTIYFEDQQKMISLLNGYNQTSHTQKFPYQNVVLIVLESFALEYMGQVNGYQGYTPFLDQLANKGLFLKNNYANGRRSIEGICALLTGIPALMSEPFISSQYQTNYFIGLGTQLTRQGYETAFFHGGNNGTMFFDQFTRSAGINLYFGANEYPNKSDHDGVWGIYDEPFLKFAAQTMSGFKRPFFSTIFTLSSHHPYQVPPHLKGQFSKGSLEIHESIGYTDYALKKFFEFAQTQDWYQDTLFILTADHAQKSDQPQYQNELGQYLIPLIFYHPQNKIPQVADQDQPTQQIDVPASVLDYLDIKTTEEMLLARSVFAAGDRYVVNFMDGQYLYVSKDLYAIQSQDLKIYKRVDVKKTNLLNENAEVLNRLNATKQYFSQGMWDNKLYYPTTK